MRPSIELELPVPVSVAGGLVLPVDTAAAPWMVNRMPPTALAVCEPEYVVPDCTDVPACSHAFARDAELLVEVYTLYCCAPATGVITMSTTFPDVSGVSLVNEPTADSPK